MNSISIGCTELLTSINFQQALYSFDTLVNSQDARAAAIQGSSQYPAGLNPSLVRPFYSQHYA
jgi:hypothetical protein